MVCWCRCGVHVISRPRAAKLWGLVKPWAVRGGLADDLGGDTTIMSELLIWELMLRGDVERTPTRMAE